MPRNGITDFLLSARNSDGKAISALVSVQDIHTFFKSTSGTIKYRLLVTQPDGIFAALEPFVWDGSSWHSFGAVSLVDGSDKYDVQSGSSKKLTISTRNSSPAVADPRSFLHGIAVTQARVSATADKK